MAADLRWEDRFFAWIGSLLKAHPWLDHQIEARAHALGVHGPALRHALRAHLDAIVILIAVMALNLTLLIYAIRSRRRRLRRRRRLELAVIPLAAQRRHRTDLRRRHVEHDFQAGAIEDTPLAIGHEAGSDQAVHSLAQSRSEVRWSNPLTGA